MAIGGFNGTDPTPTLAQFEQYVKSGEIHYFIASGTGARPGGRCEHVERDQRLGREQFHGEDRRRHDDLRPELGHLPLMRLDLLQGWGPAWRRVRVPCCHG